MNARSAARALGGEAHGNNVLAPGPGHSPRDRSLSVTFHGDGSFVVNSFAGDDPILCRDHVDARLGKEPWKPNGGRQPIGDDGQPRHSKLGKPTHVYRYANGIVCRWEYPDGSKQMRPAVRNGDGWKWVAMPIPRPLYRLEKLGAGQVIIVEGEKKADALAAVLPSISVISWAGGANAIRQSDWHPLAGRRVIIWPDNDEAGTASVHDLGVCLVKAGAASVRYLPLMRSERPPKWDAWDAIAEGMDGPAIIAWARERVRDWSPDEPAITTPPAIRRVEQLVPSESEAPVYSDESLALTFAAMNEGRVLYVAHWSRWLIWDGCRWIDDRTMASHDRVRELCRQTAAVYAQIAKSPSGPKAIASSKTVNAVLSLARSDRRIAATVGQWDTDDILLNTPEGTHIL